MSELARCSTCGYRWVSAGWTCPRCGYAPEVSRRSDGYDSYDSVGDEAGCAESCLVPLGGIAALVVIAMVLVLLLAAMTTWQFWVFVALPALGVGGYAAYRWWQNR
jgi:hypothetical protein